MANVVYFNPSASEVGHFIRVGSSGHRQLETLFASGRLPMHSLVIEAGAAPRQKELISALKEVGKNLILDTNVAELSSVGKFKGFASAAPWADPDHALTPEHFERGLNYDIIGKIARFAIENGFTIVQAPTHFLPNSTSVWLARDRKSCIALRKALDSNGGSHIGIDYPLMVSVATLRDPVQRRAIINSLSGLPFENLWLRVSGFGAEATGVGLRRYIGAALDLLRLNKPIVVDGVGGLVALAIIAFGVAGGVSHGIGEKERFDASSWDKPAKEGGGGSQKRILIPILDRQLTIQQMEKLIEAPSGRRICSCNDRACCPHGWEDMQRKPKAHYLYQRSKQVSELARVSDPRRVDHFLHQNLADANRFARKITKLKTGDDALTKALTRNSDRLDRMAAVLEELGRTMGDEPRSASPKHRPTSNRTSKYNNR